MIGLNRVFRTTVFRNILTLGLWCLIVAGLLQSPQGFAQTPQAGTPQDREPASQPYVLQPETLDFGRVFDGDSPIKTVTLLNTGESSLTIKGITTTCGCAIPRVVFPGNREVVTSEKAFTHDLGVLEPGEEAKIDVTFTTWGYKGILNKRISIQTDVPGHLRKELTVLAEIIDSVKVDPEVLDLGEVVRGQQKSATIQMTSVGIGDFSITGIKNLPPYMSCDIKRLAEGDAAAFSIEVQTRRDPPLGEWSLILQVAIDNEYIDAARFPLKVNVLPKVIFKQGGQKIDHEIDAGCFNFRDGKRVVLDVINLAPEIPYVPEEVYFADAPSSPHIAYDIETIEEGVRYRVEIEFKPDAPPASFVQGSLIFLSDHPDMLRKEIRIIGWASQGG